MDRKAAVKSWQQSNRGIFTVIAVTCQVSPEYVRQIAYETASSKHSTKLQEIQRELRKAGWPSPAGL